MVFTCVRWILYLSIIIFVAAPEAELIPKRCFKFLHENELNTFLDLLQDGKVDQSDDDEVIPKHLRLTSHQNLRRFQLKYEGPLIVQCSNPNCQRFSEIPRNGDPSIIPEHWFCSMTIARCWKNKEWTPTPREFIKVPFVALVIESVIIEWFDCL